MYIIISCQEKNPEQKILIFHDENWFWKNIRFFFEIILDQKKIPRKKILQDAIAVSNSGAFAIVIECVVESLAKKITKKVSIPTIGIGASKYCDGQILVIDDMLGLSDFFPKFVKKYSNLSEIIEKSVKNYTKDVKTRRFPSSKNVYK